MDMVSSIEESMPSSIVNPNDCHGSLDISIPPIEHETELMEKASDSITAPANIPPSPSTLIPSLKGIMSYSGGLVTCKGKWAMSDEAHNIEGQSSDFEFKLVKADTDNPRLFPINGKYQGYFLIKQAPPLKGSVKIEDKDMIMKFTPKDNDPSCYFISGQGHNKFGKFNLRGELSDNGSVHIYREYYQFNPLPTPTNKKAKPPVTPQPTTPSVTQTTHVPPPPPVEAITPRESGTRIRKQSSYLKEFHDPLQKPLPRSVSRDSVPSNSNKPVNNSHPIPTITNVPSSSGGGVERSHRLPPAMKKCSDLLKELSKLHQAQWFLEPVDPVKYNIPDYPKIIKNPMDFSTIRSNIENGVYLSINEFAEHMRLVFRNAITYNQARDSLVNIAAREISSKFEDKFRILVTQSDPSSMMAFNDLPTKAGASKLTGLKRSKSRDSGIGPKSIPLKYPPGVRPLPTYGLPPAAVDGSTMKILEMQSMIQSMQDELRQLRTVVKESEITKKLQESKEAAQNPLSFEEKKILVGQIHKLPADKMERVLSIIQDAMPQCAEGVVEVPIDSLDTLTLRKLQHFVQANVVEKKKRPYVPKGDAANKRPRKSRTPKNSTSGLESAGNYQDQNDLGLFDNQDDLLFEADSFDDIPGDEMEGQDSSNFADANVDPDEYAKEIMAEYEKLKQQGNVFVDENGERIDQHQDQSHGLDSPHDGLTSSGNDVDEDDDDNLWNEAAAEHQQKKPHLDPYSI